MAENIKVSLPPANVKGAMLLEQAIQKRRSIRSFSPKELTSQQISQLLWAAQGITARKGDYDFRAIPSAGALYPLEIYLLSAKGTFHYQPQGHLLEILGKEDLRKELSRCALGQGSVAQAGIDIIITAVYSRMNHKYGKRGIRYADIEAGHCAQNIHLEAVALGLGSVPVGAFEDEAVKKLLKLCDDVQPLYIIPVGYPSEIN